MPGVELNMDEVFNMHFVYDDVEKSLSYRDTNDNVVKHYYKEIEAQLLKNMPTEMLDKLIDQLQTERRDRQGG